MKIKTAILLFIIGLVFSGCAPKQPSDLVLLKDSLQLKFDKFPSYVGEVKNQGRRSLQLRSVAFTIWRDAKRDYIDDAGIMWAAKNIGAGETATFEVQFPDLKTKDGLSVYTCDIRWFDRRKNKIFTRSEDI